MYTNTSMKSKNTASVHSKTVCPNCNANYSNNNSSSSNIITDPESGELICSNCGLVLSSEKAQEIGHEWRSFNTEESNDRIRTGIPTSLARHDMGLSTIIGRTDRDYTGNRIATSIKSTIDRL